MNINTSEKKYFRACNFQSLSPSSLLSSLQKWLKEPKRLKKQHHWNFLFVSLCQIIMPDVQIKELLIEECFFIDKLREMIGMIEFRSETLFNGVEVKLHLTFISLSLNSKLEKVILQGSQIIEVASVNSFSSIKRGDMTAKDKKQKMLIYNRQKSFKTLFMIIDNKTIEKVKNQIFKEDHFNKLKFFIDFIFGEACPSFCAAGIRILCIDENQSLHENAQLNSECIYLIYSGTVVCFLQNLESNNQQIQMEDKKKNKQELKMQMMKRNYSLRQLSNVTNRIELHKGSIIETKSFGQVMKKIEKQTKFKFQSSKAISDSILIQVKSTEFSKAIFFDDRCKEYFLTKYDKILIARNILFTESLKKLNNFINQRHEDQENQFTISIPKRKQYNGFRKYKTARKSLEGVQNFATVSVYDTMIRSKEKVICLQNEYKNNCKSQNKLNLRYEDNKKIKQNYTRLKKKNFHIQQLALRDSVMNLKDHNAVEQIKSRIHEVKGIFQQELDEIEKIVKQQRKTNLEIEVAKKSRNLKRKELRVQSYSPKSGIYYSKSLTHRKKFGKSQQVSLANSIVSNISKQLSEQKTMRKTQQRDSLFNQRLSIKKELKQSFFIQGSDLNMVVKVNEQKYSNIFISPLKCLNNRIQNSEKRPRKTLITTTFKILFKSKLDQENSRLIIQAYLFQKRKNLNLNIKPTQFISYQIQRFPIAT